MRQRTRQNPGVADRGTTRLVLLCSFVIKISTETFPFSDRFTKAYRDAERSLPFLS